MQHDITASLGEGYSLLILNFIQEQFLNHIFYSFMTLILNLVMDLTLEQNIKVNHND